MHKTLIAVIAFVMAASSQSFGTIYFNETFSTDSPNMAAMNTTDYPDYLTRSAGGTTPATASVAGGELSLDNAPFENPQTVSLITENLNLLTGTRFTLSVDLDATSGA